MKREMMTRNNDDTGRRILVFGSSLFTSRPLATTALKRVMQVYRGPYTLVCDMTDGAARYAAVVARDLGWQIEGHEFDVTKCGPDCPTSNHRRPGGPAGDWCPSARLRNQEAMAELGADQAIVLCYGTPPSGARRDGTKEVKARGIGLWEYVQQPAKKGSN
jgi:hypothetical protein